MNIFHNWNGLLVLSVDPHWGVPLPFCIPVMCFWEFNFVHPFRMGGNQKSTVIISGAEAVEHNHEPWVLWPHLSAPVNAFFPLNIALGSHRAPWIKPTVLAEGAPTAVCLLPAGLTVQTSCTDFGHLPTGLGINTGTVMTDYTLAELRESLLYIAIDVAINLALNVLMMGAGRVVNRVAGGIMRRIRPRGGQPSKLVVGYFTPPANTRGAANPAQEVAERLMREGMDGVEFVAINEFSDEAIQGFLDRARALGADRVAMMGEIFRLGKPLNPRIELMARRIWPFSVPSESALYKWTVGAFGELFPLGRGQASQIPGLAALVAEQGLPAGGNPGAYWCNYVYRQALEQFDGQAVFMHLSSYTDDASAPAVRRFLEALAGG